MWKPLLLSAVALSLVAASINPKDEAWIGTRRSYWAFQPVVRPAVPNLSPNPIDAFVLANLSAKGWTLSPPADGAASAASGFPTKRWPASGSTGAMLATC